MLLLPSQAKTILLHGGLTKSLADADAPEKPAGVQ